MAQRKPGDWQPWNGKLSACCRRPCMTRRQEQRDTIGFVFWKDSYTPVADCWEKRWGISIRFQNYTALQILGVNITVNVLGGEREQRWQVSLTSLPGRSWTYWWVPQTWDGDHTRPDTGSVARGGRGWQSHCIQGVVSHWLCLTRRRWMVKTRQFEHRN